MKVHEFAKAIGVCKETVFNYQKRGILPDRRNPINNYRIFTDEDVANMIGITKKGNGKKRA